jgi:hypothetical protein
VSLADRIKQSPVSDRRLGNSHGCECCNFYAELSDESRAEFDQWVADGWSLPDLWKMCEAEGLRVGVFSFRNHIREHHRQKHRSRNDAR